MVGHARQLLQRVHHQVPEGAAAVGRGVSLRARSYRPLEAAAVAAVAFGLTVLLQARGGAFRSEFSAHPDESAHYVTGLMVREYVAAGAPQPPVQFAQDYYVHYPKVAIGHWPPVFYVLQAA